MLNMLYAIMVYINQQSNSKGDCTKKFQNHKFINFSCIDKVQVDFMKVSDGE
jgi:hypothetical protein